MTLGKYVIEFLVIAVIWAGIIKFAKLPEFANWLVNIVGIFLLSVLTLNFFGIIHYSVPGLM